MRKALLLTAALVAMPLMGSPAWSAECTSGSVASYTAAGFFCNVGPVIFSNIDVDPTVTGSGEITFTGFSPFTVPYNGTQQYGLTLKYVATTGQDGGTADVLWSYTVSAAPGFSLLDAYLAMSGNTTGEALILVSETLSNGVKLSLNGAGVDHETFSAINELFVLKDQLSFAAEGDFATVSALQNAFSVPGPIAGAGLPGLLIALGALVAFNRRRKTMAA